MSNLSKHEIRREAYLAAFPRLLQNGLPDLEFGAGWDRIVRDLLAGIDPLLDDRDAAGFEVLQIKEKFGTLRFYYEVDGKAEVHFDILREQGRSRLVMLPTPGMLAFPAKEVDELIRQAEDASERTCESCGRPGQLVGAKNWYTSTCEPCLRAKQRGGQSGGL